MDALSGVAVADATVGGLAVALVAVLASVTRSEGPAGGDDVVTRERLRVFALAASFGVIGFVAILVWASLLAGVVRGVVGDPTTLQETVLLQASNGLGTLTGVALFLDYTDRDRSYLDVAWPSRRDAGYAAAGLVFVFGTFLAVTLLLSVLGVDSAAHGTQDTIAEAGNPAAVTLVFVVTSVLVIGPGEELLYRNVVQKSLYEAFSRPAAVVVGSVVFAAIHLPAYDTATLPQVVCSTRHSSPSSPPRPPTPSPASRSHCESPAPTESYMWAGVTGLDIQPPRSRVE